MNWLRHNWITAISLITAFLGIGLSIYFYNISKQIREPVIVVTKNFPIFALENGLPSSKIAIISQKDNKEITKNIFIQEITIWNNGNLPIKSEHILEDLKFQFDSDVDILDSFISETTRESVIKPEIRTNLPNNEILITFKILEGDDGLKIQVIYASDEKQLPIIEGAVEGVKSIKSADTLSNDNVLKATLQFIIFVLILILAIALSVFSIFFVRKIIFRFFPNHHEKIYDAVSLAFGLILAIFAIYFLVIITLKGVSLTADQNVLKAIPLMSPKSN